MNYRLSVILPTYNRRDRLEKSLLNYLEENIPCIEFIILDNASTDGTQELIQSIIKQDSRVKYFKNPQNIGYNRSLYRGFLAMIKECEFNKIKQSVMLQWKQIVAAVDFKIIMQSIGILHKDEVVNADNILWELQQLIRLGYSKFIVIDRFDDDNLHKKLIVVRWVSTLSWLQCLSKSVASISSSFSIICRRVMHHLPLDSNDLKLNIMSFLRPWGDSTAVGAISKGMTKCYKKFNAVDFFADANPNCLDYFIAKCVVAVELLLIGTIVGLFLFSYRTAILGCFITPIIFMYLSLINELCNHMANEIGLQRNSTALVVKCFNALNPFVTLTAKVIPDPEDIKLTDISRKLLLTVKENIYSHVNINAELNDFMNEYTAVAKNTT